MMKTKALRGQGPRSRGSWKSGKADDLGDVFFRSSWERNYARYLNFLIGKGEVTSWSFEKETFWFDGVRRGAVSYKPDFKVAFPDGHVEYHEVKGWMDSRSRTTIKRMAKYHPNVVLKVIDGPAYRELCKWGRLFSPHWEFPV